MYNVDPFPERKLPRLVDSWEVDFSGRIFSRVESDEVVKVQRIAGRWDPEGRRSRGPGRSDPAQARHQPSHLLRVEVPVRGASVAELKRLKELEAENAKLKRIVRRSGVGERSDQGCVGPKVVTPSAKHEAVQFMTQEHGLFVQRACSSAR